MRIAIGIDPGLDVTGVAEVRWAPGDVHPFVARRASLRTAPSTPMAERLRLIRLNLRHEIEGILGGHQHLSTTPQITIALELPGYAGVHARVRRGRSNIGNLGREQMLDFAQALGVVRCTLAELARSWPDRFTVRELDAPGIRKKDRHATFQAYVAAGKNEDERDAIVVGVLALLADAPTHVLALTTARPA